MSEYHMKMTKRSLFQIIGLYLIIISIIPYTGNLLLKNSDQNSDLLNTPEDSALVLKVYDQSENIGTRRMTNNYKSSSTRLSRYIEQLTDENTDPRYYSSTDPYRDNPFNVYYYDNINKAEVYSQYLAGIRQDYPSATTKLSDVYNSIKAIDSSYDKIIPMAEESQSLSDLKYAEDGQYFYPKDDEFELIDVKSNIPKDNLYWNDEKIYNYDRATLWVKNAIYKGGLTYSLTPIYDSEFYDKIIDSLDLAYKFDHNDEIDLTPIKEVLSYPYDPYTSYWDSDNWAMLQLRSNDEYWTTKLGTQFTFNVNLPEEIQFNDLLLQIRMRWQQYSSFFSLPIGSRVRIRVEINYNTYPTQYFERDSTTYGGLNSYENFQFELDRNKIYDINEIKILAGGELGNFFAVSERIDYDYIRLQYTVDSSFNAQAIYGVDLEFPYNQDGSPEGLNLDADLIASKTEFINSIENIQIKLNAVFPTKQTPEDYSKITIFTPQKTITTPENVDSFMFGHIPFTTKLQFELVNDAGTKSYTITIDNLDVIKYFVNSMRNYSQFSDYYTIWIGIYTYRILGSKTTNEVKINYLDVIVNYKKDNLATSKYGLDYSETDRIYWEITSNDIGKYFGLFPDEVSFKDIPNDYILQKFKWNVGLTDYLSTSSTLTYSVISDPELMNFEIYHFVDTPTDTSRLNPTNPSDSIESITLQFISPNYLIDSNRYYSEEYNYGYGDTQKALIYKNTSYFMRSQIVSINSVVDTSNLFLYPNSVLDYLIYNSTDDIVEKSIIGNDIIGNDYLTEDQLIVTSGELRTDGKIDPNLWQYTFTDNSQFCVISSEQETIESDLKDHILLNFSIKLTDVFPMIPESKIFDTIGNINDFEITLDSLLISQNYTDLNDWFYVSSSSIDRCNLIIEDENGDFIDYGLINPDFTADTFEINKDVLTNGYLNFSIDIYNSTESPRILDFWIDSLTINFFDSLEDKDFYFEGKVDLSEIMNLENGTYSDKLIYYNDAQNPTEMGFIINEDSINILGNQIVADQFGFDTNFYYYNFSVFGDTDLNYSAIVYAISGKNSISYHPIYEYEVKCYSNDILLNNCYVENEYIKGIATYSSLDPPNPEINLEFQNLNSGSTVDLEILEVSLVPYYFRDNYISNSSVMYNKTDFDPITLDPDEELNVTINIDFTGVNTTYQRNLYTIFVKFKETGQTENSTFVNNTIFSETEIAVVGDIVNYTYYENLSNYYYIDSNFTKDPTISHIVCYIMDEHGNGDSSKYLNDFCFYFGNQNSPKITINQPLENELYRTSLLSIASSIIDAQSDISSVEIRVYNSMYDTEYITYAEASPTYYLKTLNPFDMETGLTYILIRAVDSFLNYAYKSRRILIESYKRVELNTSMIVIGEVNAEETQAYVDCYIPIEYPFASPTFRFDLSSNYADARDYKIQRSPINIYYALNSPSEGISNTGRYSYWKFKEIYENDIMTFRLRCPLVDWEYDNLLSNFTSRVYTIRILRQDNIRSYENVNIIGLVQLPFEQFDVSLIEITGDINRNITDSANIKAEWVTESFVEYLQLNFTAGYIIKNVDYGWKLIFTRTGESASEQKTFLSYFLFAVIGLSIGLSSIELLRIIQRRSYARNVRIRNLIIGGSVGTIVGILIAVFM